MKNNKLDQFYTNPKVTDYLVKKIHSMFNLEQYKIFEPAAGTGNFIDSLYKIGLNINEKCYAFDIEPKNNNFIKKADFLKLKINKYITNKNNNLVITNPPFGKRGNLAIEFINKSLEFADIVCMILPNTFNRYLVQKRIKESAKLIYSEYLPENSFIVKDREYSVKCSFQIWTNKNVQTWLSDKRLRNNNVQKIKGLELFIHNNTKETLKYFDKEFYNWNFAIVRQGYYDYSKKITNPDELKRNRQYIFIKTENPYLLKLIEEIDFEALASKNTVVKGFSNTDLIGEIYKLHINKILKF
ncbi:hypothetical protein RRG53_03395 [Mycoplasmopsis cynos]|uniref:DNA methylase n=1 Tax=Mycoplasmopsis cynos TaxID=171284 RepID=A0A449AIP1_9BACT|nr:hypothetical protein [Mycoplasmopsis cynos]WQQ18323.1 hypothetical protein RRG53_03395 [Mycoplasmopsis cynos]VEU64857.1 DNA methylase [Mycoplasmopsis cynos]